MSRKESYKAKLARSAKATRGVDELGSSAPTNYLKKIRRQEYETEKYAKLQALSRAKTTVLDIQRKLLDNLPGEIYKVVGPYLDAEYDKLNAIYEAVDAQKDEE